MVSTCGVYPEKLNLSDLNNENMEPFDGHDCYARGKVYSFIIMYLFTYLYRGQPFISLGHDKRFNNIWNTVTIVTEYRIYSISKKFHWQLTDISCKIKSWFFFFIFVP